MTSNANGSKEEQHVLYGGPDCDLVEADAKSLGEVVQRMLAAQGDREIIVDASNGHTINASELLRQSVRLAECLRDFGVTSGDVIGLCSENRTQFPVPVMACFIVGATLAPLSISYTESELRHAVNLSKPKIVFASALVLSRIAECAQCNRFIQQIVSFDDSPELGRNCTTLDAFISNPLVPSRSRFESPANDMATTTALVMCSSGTAGLPKGVQLTQSNLHMAVSQLAQTKLTNGHGQMDMTSLNVVPWFHAYGMLSMFRLALSGRRIVTLGRYEARAFLRAIEKYACNVLFAVPPLVAMLAHSPLVAEYDLSSVKVVYCGAAPLSKATIDGALERVPSALGVFQGFGMSEMTLTVLQQNPMLCAEGSVGSLRPGIWGKIVDPKTGRALGVGERGEMCFKGPAVMKGYIGDEAATRQTIDADGWLHTGDIGYYSEDGEWFVVDRLKELIKYNGYQVPPAELEAILLSHPDVLDAGVIGVVDERCGEKAKGFVVKRRGAQLTEEAVRAFVAEKVSFAKQLHGGVQFVAEIPKNVTGKILRRKLRDLQTELQSKL